MLEGILPIFELKHLINPSLQTLALKTKVYEISWISQTSTRPTPNQA